MSSNPFVLGDPKGKVTWDAKLLKKVFPRREMQLKPLKAPKPADLDAYWTYIAGNAQAYKPLLDRSTGHAAAQEESNADAVWAFKNARKLLLEPRPARFADDQEGTDTAGMLLHLASLGDHLRASSHVHFLVDLFVYSNGLSFAIRAFVSMLRFSLFNVRAETDAIGVPLLPKARKGYGDGPTAMCLMYVPVPVVCSPLGLNNNFLDDGTNGANGWAGVVEESKKRRLYLGSEDMRPWLRLREHLATTSAENWQAADDAADEIRQNIDASPFAAADATYAPSVKRLIAFLFPEKPEWAEALVGDGHDERLLSGLVRDTSTLTYFDSMYFLQYFFDEEEGTLASTLAAAGPKAAKALKAVSKNAVKAPIRKFATSLLECM